MDVYESDADLRNRMVKALSRKDKKLFDSMESDNDRSQLIFDRVANKFRKEIDIQIEKERAEGIRLGKWLDEQKQAFLNGSLKPWQVHEMELLVEAMKEY